MLVFDEAQRAFDAAEVAARHDGRGDGKSEPEHFVDFAERVPDWCVVVGLIGTGQEIHVGEEAGLVQWRWAIERSIRSGDWTVHAPPDAAAVFHGLGLRISERLHLVDELRFKLATEVHDFVQLLLEGQDPGVTRPVGDRLARAGYRFRVTRNLDAAKTYLRRRYSDDPAARFGLIASSKDRDLGAFGVPNDFQSTKRVRYGPWFADDEDDPGRRSCRWLRDCVTEFGCQGLELDASLLAWGTDLMMRRGAWTNDRARGYRSAARVVDPMQLRKNAYRVLLTRGRDATIVFVPDLPRLDETFEYLVNSGFGSLEDLPVR